MNLKEKIDFKTNKLISSFPPFSVYSPYSLVVLGVSSMVAVAVHPKVFALDLNLHLFPWQMCAALILESHCQCSHMMLHSMAEVYMI